MGVGVFEFLNETLVAFYMWGHSFLHTDVTNANK